MKKQIILLLALLSLCQSTYPVLEGVKQTAASITAYLKGKKEQISALSQKYGRTTVNEAIAMIKKYKPKGLIARYNEAERDLNAAENAFNACIRQHCREEHMGWSWARRVIRKGIYPVGSKNYELLQAKMNTYFSCKRGHCQREDGALDAAGRRLDGLGRLFGVAIPLGIITATALAGGATMALLPEGEQKKEWSSPSPLYESKP